MSGEPHPDRKCRELHQSLQPCIVAVVPLRRRTGAQTEEGVLLPPIRYQATVVLTSWELVECWLGTLSTLPTHTMLQLWAHGSW